MEKKEQYSLYMLPTKKKNQGFFLGLNTVFNKLYLLSELHATGGVLIPQHLYITSRGIIKEGDWHILYGELKQVTKEYTQLISAKGDKVIASTDRNTTLDCWINLDEDKWIIEYYNKYKVLPSVQLQLTENPYSCYGGGEPNRMDFEDAEEYRERHIKWKRYIPTPKTFSNGTVFISNPNTKKYDVHEVRQKMKDSIAYCLLNPSASLSDNIEWIENNLKN